MQIKQIDIKTISNISKSVYLSEAWLSLYDDGLQCYGIYNKGEQLIGGFIIYLEKKVNILNFYRNPTYSPTTNLFFQNKAQNKSKLLSENKKVLTLFSNFIQNLKADILSVSLPYTYTDTQVFFWDNYKVIPNYTYLINLNQDIVTIENNFSTERRNDIKKAIKDNVSVEISQDFKLIKSLVENTFNRKKKTLDSQFLDKILFEFANQDNSYAYISFQNNKAIACSFCIYDKEKVYYILGGYDKDYKHQGAGALAVSSAIKHAKNMGIKTFDFEGSMLPEVERYFRGFGGDLTPYYSINKAKLAIEIGLKFIKRNQF